MPVLNKQVHQILNTLRSRDVALRWVADEIIAVIERGKPSTKTVKEPGKKRGVKAATTESLTETDEMLVTLKSLNAYFCEAPQMWEKSASFAAESLTLPAREKATKRPFQLRLQDEEGTPIDFAAIDNNVTAKLSALIAEAQKEEQES